MARVQAEAGLDGAAGVVGVKFDIESYAWGDHSVEFFAAGTAVRPTGHTEPITPSFVLPMSDCGRPNPRADAAVRGWGRP